MRLALIATDGYAGADALRERLAPAIELVEVAPPAPPAGAAGALATLLVELEAALSEPEPDAVAVAGEDAAALAGALVAVKLQLPLARLDAGVRDPAADPGEPPRGACIYRRLADRLAGLRLCAGGAELEALRAEGLAEGTVVVQSSGAEAALAEAIAAWLERS